MSKETLSTLAIALTIIIFIPYLKGIFQNQIKPHVFSWVIWGITTCIVFFAALYEGGGAGVWPIGFSGAITICIAIIAYFKKGDIHITKLDWLFFLTALSTIPLWFFMDDPMWSVIILTIVDLLGFGPTIRKAYDNPYEENPIFFLLYFIRTVMVLFALEKYSITTALFPTSITIACLIVVVLLYYRRNQLKYGGSAMQKE